MGVVEESSAIRTDSNNNQEIIGCPTGETSSHTENNTDQEILSCATDEERLRFGELGRSRLPPSFRTRNDRINDTIADVAAGNISFTTSTDSLSMVMPSGGTYSSSFRIRSKNLYFFIFILFFEAVSPASSRIMAIFCAKMRAMHPDERGELEKPFITNLLQTADRIKSLSVAKNERMVFFDFL
ncbi:hypothetical protein DICVIV_06631 [Dictyocaulus viviparus]|uniref:Uncharacterized protein n=1 Tax=Dictyocaulus viviparus TaxID=29172 RepID=A0A0D8XRY9_DICVI|nr:hypothetical protein DICVIV_06631 [Dictyocaulus viviparus]